MAAVSTDPLALSVRDLRTWFQTEDGTVKAVDGISFDLKRGETLGIVGESGSGKSVTNLSIIRLIPQPAGKIVSGEVIFDGSDLMKLPPSEVKQIRGRRISMVFQDPMTSLNPFLRISTQLMEITQLHLGHSKSEAYQHAIKMLEMVGIPDAKSRVNGYPHEFSGGMRQRVMIAMALSCRPELLIADEPTTALDVTIQAQILELIKRLKEETGASVILITHDLGVVAGMTDHIVVMYAGKIFERAPTRELFASPGNPYTRGLLRSVPSANSEPGALSQIPGLPPDVAHLPPGCPFAPRCDRAEEICRREFPPFVQLNPEHHSLCHFAKEVYASNHHSRRDAIVVTPAASPEEKKTVSPAEPLLQVRDFKVQYDLGGGGLFGRITRTAPERRIVRAVDGVSLDIFKGETLGLAGESGCGKSTFGKALLRLTEPAGGKVLYRGKDLAALPQAELRQQRRFLQMIFQDPYASLNPRLSAGEIIREPLDTFACGKRGERERRVRELMETVGLDPRFVRRYPHEFSGGQRQRIGIARALAADPEFIVADEPVSALDVSIQAQIMNLLQSLKDQRNLTCLFISHDLRAIRHVSNRIAVMYLGRLVELGQAHDVYDDPLMPYTKALISAVPLADPEAEAKRRRMVLQGDVPSPINPPAGCPFHTRCPWAVQRCKEVLPPLLEIKPKHFAACIRISPSQPRIEDVPAGATPGLDSPARAQALD